MVRFESIRNIINTFIRPNGKGEITGETMNNVLQGMLDDIDSALEESGASSEGGNSGGDGVSTLAGLTDVKISSLADGQSLVYDSATGMWRNRSVSGGQVTSENIISALGYTPFDSDAFTKPNIQSILGIKSWALASSKPSYTFAEITSKPTTLSGYGITDGLVYSDYINLDSAYRHIGYGYTSLGWKTAGPAAVFGTALYNLRMQCAITNTNVPYVYVSQMYNGVAKEWAELVTYEGAAGKEFDALKYKMGGTDVLQTSGNHILLNYGNRTTGDLYLYGKNLRFTIDGGSSYPLKILNDGSLLIHDITLTKGTSNSMKSGAYEALNYFADGKLIMHRNAGAENLYFNYGGATEPLYSYASYYGFHVGESRERAFTIASTKNAIFAADVDVAGMLYSKNFPQGKSFSQDPTSSFISTMFDADAVGDAIYRMRLVKTGGTGFDGVCSPYSPMLVVKSTDTHGYISFGYNDYGRNHCYIGGGNADKINWSGILFHNNMSLIPKTDNTFDIGDPSYRWKGIYASNLVASALYGPKPSGGSYNQYRMIYSEGRLYLQAGSNDGATTAGIVTISGINVAALTEFHVFAKYSLFTGDTQVNGTSRFVSLATFDKGLKIGDATITWDASAGMLKADKGIYSTADIVAGK